MDSELPFGLQSAPKIFTAIVDALEWCMAQEGVQAVYHYLDDFIILDPPSSEVCGESLQILHKVCNDLGAPFSTRESRRPQLSNNISRHHHRHEQPGVEITRRKIKETSLYSRTMGTAKILHMQGARIFDQVMQHVCTVIQPGRTLCEM